MKIIKVKSEKDIPLEGLGKKIALTMLKHHKEYKCIIDGKKVHFIKAF